MKSSFLSNSDQREDVLLMVPHVKHKKVEGGLYVMNTRIAWVTQSGEHVRINAPYEEIRMQRISSEGKEKVQIQIKMHGTESYTFHFTDPKGRKQQIHARDSVKELLDQLLPKFLDKVVHELDHKVGLLKRHPRLYTLYEELVVSGILCVEEFWAMKQVQDQLQQGEQEVGVPSSLLSNVKPITDGQHGTRYNLTDEMITAIFRLYPSVKKRHMELVPQVMTEGEFWTNFFQSHYFHRDRAHIQEKDVFAQCAQWDDEQMRVEVNNQNRDSFLNIASLSDYDIGDGYGLPTSITTTALSKHLMGFGVSSVSKKDEVNKKLIQRINHMSLMVLNTQSNASNLSTDQQADKPSGAAAAVASGSKSHNGKSNKRSRITMQDKASTSSATNNVGANNNIMVDSTLSADKLLAAKMRRIEEKITLSDLILPNHTEHVLLNLDKIDNYLQGPISFQEDVTGSSFAGGQRHYGVGGGTSVNDYGSSTTATSQHISQQEALHLCHNLLESLQLWKGSLLQGCLSPTSALTGLGDMAGFGGDDSESVATGSISASASSKDSTSQWIAKSLLNHPELERDFHRLYIVLSELLRHFWLCFPVTTSLLEQKVHQMNESLQKFRDTKLDAFKRQAHQMRPDVSLCDHIELMLDKADAKYTSWKMRRGK